MLLIPYHFGPREDSAASSKSPSVNESPSSSHLVTELDFPEGGMEAWCTVFGAFLVQFCGYGYVNSFGVYQAYYADQYLQDKSSSAISWIGSSAAFLHTAIGPLCGPLFDNGYFYHLCIIGAILQSLSIFMLSLVQPGQYYQVLGTQGIISGVGQGLMYVPSFAILSHHFKRRRAAMMSIVASGVALGGIAHTIMLNQLLNGPIGFKKGVQTSATFITVLLFLSCILMRTRYGAVHQKATSINTWKATKKCFTEVPSLLTITGFMLFQSAFTYPYFYLQLDSLRHGLGDSFAFYSLVIINVGSFVGRFSAGAVLKSVGVIDLTIITTVACAVLIVGMIWLSSIASMVVLGVLYGLFSGMNVAMMAPMLGLTSNPEELGARLGVGFAITGTPLYLPAEQLTEREAGLVALNKGIGGLVGSPICGALLTDRYIWWAPALFCGAAALAGAILFVVARILFARGARAARKRGDEATESGTDSGRKWQQSPASLTLQIPKLPVQRFSGSSLHMYFPA